LIDAGVEARESAQHEGNIMHRLFGERRIGKCNDLFVGLSTELLDNILVGSALPEGEHGKTAVRECVCDTPDREKSNYRYDQPHAPVSPSPIA
jgi:hypothetical protein